MKIEIKGVIVSNDEKEVYDFLGIDAVSPAEVIEAIDEASGEKLEVEINSPGGNVFAGSEIYTSLMDYPGEVEAKIVGVAASAGSIVAMSAGTTRISPTAQIMIHNVQNIAQGDKQDFRKNADILDGWDETISNAYQIKTNLSQEKLLELMNEETWLTPQEAKEYGFVDEIMFEQANQLAASAGNVMLSQEVVKEVKQKIRSRNKDKDNIDQAKARLKLLKLKGADVNVYE